MPGLVLAVGLISFLSSLINHQRQWFDLWLVLLGVIITRDGYQKRSPYGTLYILLRRAFVLHETDGAALSAKALRPKDLSSQFTVIKSATNRS